MAEPFSLWRLRAFREYLASTGFSGLAFAMQQLLASWILVGILELPADQVGLLQAAIGIPGIFILLAGGAKADQGDPRKFLAWVYFTAPLLPLFLAANAAYLSLSIWSVLVWGIGVGFAQSFSMPGQQAILNHITKEHVQRGVAAATAVGFVIQVLGLLGAGFIDRVGVPWMLVVQATAFLAAGVMITRLPQVATNPPSTISAVQQIRQGLHAIRRQPIVFDVLTINFVSTIFNAGSFMTVFPFIVKRVYEGDAFTFSTLLALFYAGAALSNMLLLKVLPLRRPGRVFLVLQLSRIIVLAMLYVRGDWWLLIAAMFLWGMNMGVTTNLARTIVQESAPAEFRGRILSVFTISVVGSAPIGAVVLGILVEQVGTLNALLPAMVLSLLIFAYGLTMTPIWRYQSPHSSVTI